MSRRTIFAIITLLLLAAVATSVAGIVYDILPLVLVGDVLAASSLLVMIFDDIRWWSRRHQRRNRHRFR